MTQAEADEFVRNFARMYLDELHMQHLVEALVGEVTPEGLRSNEAFMAFENQTVEASEDLMRNFVQSLVDFADTYFEGSYPKID